MALADDTSNAPTQQIALASVGDHCVNCGAPLASDQRYCVNCGERRGKPRFTLAETATVVETTSRGPLRPPRRPRTSATFNLIAGVATLLLAMGVGVLIGANSNSTPTKAASNQPIVITTAGGGSSGAASATTNSATTASGSNGGSSAKSKTGKSAKSSAAAAPPKVVIQKAAAAASKVVGGGAAVAGATATQGSSCASGTAGCQNGKLTGGFFGQ